METQKVINGVVFKTRTYYTIYNSLEDSKNYRAPFLVTMDSDEFEKLKAQVEQGVPLPNKKQYEKGKFYSI